MRKIFAGAMLFSVIGAVILGGTLAWQNTLLVADNETVDVGLLQWGSVYTQSDDAQLGPNGYTTTVGYGSISNTGDFNIQMNSGRVIIVNVDAGHASCDTDNFVGTVESLWEGDLAQLAPGQTLDDAYRVKIKVIQSAPFACMGATVTYDVFITVGTLDNGPPEPGE